MATKRIQLAALMLAASIAANAEVRKFSPGFNLFSKEQDIALGKESSAAVRKQMPVIHNADLEKYVQAIGQIILGESERLDGGFWLLSNARYGENKRARENGGLQHGVW